MSLDLYLYGEAGTSVKNAASSGIFIRIGGEMVEVTEAEFARRNPGVEPARVIGSDDLSERPVLWHRNITHNLNTMADAAGIYGALWRPDENGIEVAEQSAPIVAAGLADLEARRAHFEQFNPENGWGDYELLVDFARSFLAACRAHPTATVYACR